MGLMVTNGVRMEQLYRGQTVTNTLQANLEFMMFDFFGKGYGVTGQLGPLK